MKRMAELVGRDLIWNQPKALKAAFDLSDGAEVVSTLVFRSSFGSLATATSAEGAWTFKRQGFFHPTVTVRPEGQESDLAIFRNRTWKAGGTLEFPDGRHLLGSTNFWQTRYEWTTENDTPVISYRRRSGILHVSATMVLHDPAKDWPELPWIASLGWYLKVLMQRDSAAAAG